MVDSSYRSPDNPDEMAARLRAARAWSGMKQKELAERMGLSESTIERMEKGDASALGRTPDKRRRVRAAVAEATGIWPGFFIAVWGDADGGQPDDLAKLEGQARAALQARGVDATWRSIAEEVLGLALKRAAEEAAASTGPRAGAGDPMGEVDLHRLLPTDEDDDEARSERA